MPENVPAPLIASNLYKMGSKTLFLRGFGQSPAYYITRTLGMLIMLIPPCRRMLLAREMLIMLIMLIHIWDSWENPEMDLTLLTLLTFPLPEAFFARHRGNVNNVNNVKSIFLKNASGRGNVHVNSYLGLLGKSGNGFNIINIINISPARSIFSSPQGKC